MVKGEWQELWQVRDRVKNKNEQLCREMVGHGGGFEKKWG